MAGHQHVHDSSIGRLVNDPFTEHAVGAGEWSMPGDVGHELGVAELPPQPPLYTDGIFVGVGSGEAVAVPGALHPKLVRVRTDAPPSYQTPHESTHRRYEAPFMVAVAQAAAGTLMLVPPKMGLHYVKLLGYTLSLDAAGTLKFVQGSGDGTMVADMTGAMAVGGAAAPLLHLPTVDPPNPHMFTSPDQALGITTTVGKASGWLMVCYSPYEA